MISRPALKSLNGLRFFVILHLVLLHFLALHRAVFKNEGIFAELPLQLFNLVISGTTATGLFFILSGFILTYVYFDDQRQGLKVDFKRFYVSRVSRIFPLHAVLMIILLVSGLGDPSWSLTQWFIGLTLTQTFIPTAVSSWNTPAWAASCMMFLYALFPIILKRLAQLSRTKLMLVMGLCIAVNWLLSIGFYWNLDQFQGEAQSIYIASFYYTPFIWAGYFILGICGGLWFLTQKSKLFRFWYLPDLLLVIMLFMMINIQAFPHAIMRHCLFMAFQFLLILSLAEDKGAFSTLCRLPFVQRIAPASFTIYLLHAPLFLIWFPLFRRTIGTMPWWGLLSYFVVLVLLADVIEKVFVEPCRRMISRRIFHRVTAPVQSAN